MMNKLEEYLNSLDKKNIYMLYASIVIAAFVIYYNFNYSYLNNLIQNNDAKIFNLKRQTNNETVLYVKLKKMKKELKSLKKKNTSLIEDLNYLNMLINTTPILNINEMKFLDILSAMLQNASDNGIAGSYTISKYEKGFFIYEVDINGVFSKNNFRNFYKFIKAIEGIRAIKNIKTLTFTKNKNVEFTIQCQFWSIK